jgi:hypothetical protein|tara:strand:- start:395 stop:502 length:108 start_codon:yes stop_codon:yes gene_type:complete
MSQNESPTAGAEAPDKATFIEKKQPPEFLPCFWVA